MIKSKTLLLIIGCLLLAACKTSRTHHNPPPTVPALELAQFAVIDSYGVDSGIFPNKALHLDPYAYEGMFEIYWDVTPNRNYDFYLSVGPTPNIADSVTFFDAACGPNQYCGRTGYEVCYYSLDYELVCANQPGVNVSNWIAEVPQPLYLFAEVCGPRSCESRRLGVLAL